MEKALTLMKKNEITMKTISSLFIIILIGLVALTYSSIYTETTTLETQHIGNVSGSGGVGVNCLIMEVGEVYIDLPDVAYPIKDHAVYYFAREHKIRNDLHPGDSIDITQNHGFIEYVNDNLCRITGYQATETINKPLNILRPKNDEFKNTPCILDSKYLQGQDNWEGDVLCSKKDNSEFWNAITISAVFDKEGEISNYVFSAVDVTALKQANKKMEHLALFDSLTGLANRRLFIERLHQSVLNAPRQKNITALLFLDLDQFKRINDTLGHQAGDQLL